jgi:hypothetical protein
MVMAKNSKLTVSEAEIGLRAYQIWEAEGKPIGKDFDHWLRAEAELAGKAAATKSATAKKVPAKRTPAKKA